MTSSTAPMSPVEVRATETIELMQETLRAITLSFLKEGRIPMSLALKQASDSGDWPFLEQLALTATFPAGTDALLAAAPICPDTTLDALAPVSDVEALWWHAVSIKAWDVVDRLSGFMEPEDVRDQLEGRPEYHLPVLSRSEALVRTADLNKALPTAASLVPPSVRRRM